jgi:hypothetical protein
MAPHNAVPRLPGLATAKVLAGSLGLSSFTTEELAEQVGVAKPTVDDVVRNRYKEYFCALGPEHAGRPGRPKQRWAIQEDRVSDVASIVRAVRDVGRDTRHRSVAESDLVDAYLVMAANAVTSVRGSDPVSAQALIDTADGNLRLAGFESDGSPIRQDLDDPMLGKARLIAVVRDLVDAELSNDHMRIDVAKLRALPVLTATSTDMRANEWLPLAMTVSTTSSSIIPATVMIPKVEWPYVHSVLPNLEVVRSGVLGSIFAMDNRITRGVAALFQSAAEPIAAVVHSSGFLERFARVAGSEIMVSGSVADLSAARDYGAHFVLADNTGSFATQVQVANQVTRIGLGLELPG